MSSIHVDGHYKGHLNSLNVSQTSEDLFEESPRSTCGNTFKSSTNRIKSSQENDSETSEELHFLSRRKPRKALNYSNDSTTCYDNRNSSGFKSSVNNSSSKFFHPISPELGVHEASSSTLHEFNHSDSTKNLKSTDFQNLSKKNVEIISFVSESDHSDSSSILDDSFNCESENQISTKSFRTPIFSSVKKRTICKWLSNVSLGHSFKQVRHRTDFKPDFISDLHITKNQNDFNVINASNLNSSLEFINVGCVETFNTNHFGVLNGVRASSCNSVDLSENSACNYIQCLFAEYENAPIKHEIYNNFSLPDNNCEIKHNSLIECHNSLTKFTDLKPQSTLSEPMGNSCHKEFVLISESNITNDESHLSFQKSSCCQSDEGNYSSIGESDLTFNGINKNKLKVGDSDDECYTKVRSLKKKRNFLNISSDDSEAKDTANESEDIPNHDDPYTPRRRLYFRNPLNNSLDDDAEPVIYGIECDGKINANSDTNCSEKYLVKSEGLIDQICSEVLNISIKSSKESSIQNQDVSTESKVCSFNKEHVDSVTAVQNNFFTPCKPDSTTQSCSSNNQLKCDADEQLNHSKWSNVSSNITHHNNSEILNKNDSLTNIQTNEATTLNKSNCSDIHNSLTALHTELNESCDSMVFIKRKNKRNVLNDSMDSDSFDENKPKSNVIDVAEISSDDLSPKNKVKNSPLHVPIVSPKITFVNLVNSVDSEYDKYIYRERSDSSSSGSQDDSVLPSDSVEDVISLHTTTSNEGDDDYDDDDAPWNGLESYLKKNVPASSKSLESSFLKNIDKRKAQLAKVSLPSHSNCPEHTSFLLSLTPEVPDEICHPAAVKYRDSFSKHKDELVDLLFKLYNKEIFDDKLPPLEIKWSGHLTTTSGITKSSSKITKSGKIRSSVIKLSKTVVNNAGKLRDVLLHELCHAANWLIDEQAGGHGPLFKKWVRKIWTKFPEVPKVKTTHHYELKWKYLYKCTFCGYELGKMKLTLNENSCRLCGGLVTVNE